MIREWRHGISIDDSAATAICSDAASFVAHGDELVRAHPVRRLSLGRVGDSAAEKALGPEDLIELGPDLRAGVQPYIRLLEFEDPVDKLLIQVNRASEEHEEASNAVLKQKHPDLVRPVIRLKRKRTHLAVHRMDFVVYYRRLAGEEFRILNALREGQPVEHAIQYGFENSTASLDEQRPMLERWFATWAELGWLCPPARVKKERVTT